MISVRQIYELRNKGQTEEAYEAARTLFATEKNLSTSSVMFWTAVDMLKLRLYEGRIDEAKKIYLALDRLSKTMTDENGKIHNTLTWCNNHIEQYTKERLLTDRPAHLQMGLWGEEIAVAYLSEKGYMILERDWHSKHRDIDIIAKDNDCLVFVEVKTRTNREFTDPVFAVGYQKQRNLRFAMNHYIKFRNYDGPFRFDVITVVGNIGDAHPEITHIEDFVISMR